MSNTPSLLPCPFCGAVPHLKRSTRGDYTSIVCHGECSGPLVIVIPNDLIEEGAAAWNRRTPQPVVREPLTDEQLYEEKHNAVPQLFDLARDWADNKIHSYQFANEAERIVNVVARRVEAAHGIKGGQHGSTE